MTSSEQVESQAPRERIPWAHLFSYKEMWCLMLGQAGYLYVYFVFLTWLPSYLIMERGMNVLKTGFLSSLPFIIAVCIGIFSGWLSDRWLQKGASLTLVRKTFIGGGFLLSTIFIILGVNIESEGVALFFIFMSMGILGMTSPNLMLCRSTFPLVMLCHQWRPCRTSAAMSEEPWPPS